MEVSIMFIIVDIPTVIRTPDTSYSGKVFDVFPVGSVTDITVTSSINHSYGIYSSKFSPDSRVNYTDYIILSDGSSDDYYVYLVHDSYSINRQNK